MALTEAEAARLSQLEAKYGSQSAERIPAQSPGLSPAEQARLNELEAKYGRSPSQIPMNNLPKDNGSVNEGNPAQAQPSRPLLDELGDRAQTQLESFGNTVSMGYLPHIQAAFEKINPNPTANVDEQLRAQGFQIEDPSYVQMRDENILRQQDQAQRNKSDAIAGTLGGMAVQAPLIAKTAAQFGAGQVPTVIGRIKDSVTTGFGLGAISNPGDTQGQLNVLQGTERLTNAGTGGALGAAGQAGGDALAKAGSAIKNAPKTFDTISKVKAFKSVGAMLKDFRAARGNNSPEAIGETLLSKGIVNAGDSLEDMAEKLTTSKQETGQTIRNIYKGVGDYISGASKTQQLTPRQIKLLDGTKLNGQKIAGDARVEIIKAFKNNPGNQEAKAKVLSALDDIAAMGDDIDIQDMLESRVNLDAQINYAKKMNDLPIVQQQLKTLRDKLHTAIQTRVRAVGVVVKDKELINQLKTANKEYGHLATAEAIAKDKISRESANNFFSLGDNLSAGAGATIGAASGDSLEDKVKNGLIGFVTGRVASKYGRYSLPMISRASKKLGEALKQPANFAKYGEPLIEAAKRSPQEFQALLNQLGKEPEFAKLATPGH